MKAKLWVLEDDSDCRDYYEKVFNERYSVDYIESFEEFEKIYNSIKKKPELIIVDLMLGGVNFANFLKNTRDTGGTFDLPFLVVSSLDDKETLRFCFDMGATDYLTKPYKKNELLVKLENTLKKLRDKRISGKDFKIDGKLIEGLTSKQVQILNLFSESEGRKISREEILEKVWGKTNVRPKTVDVHLYNLRRKIRPYGYIIKSLRNEGWELISGDKKQLLEYKQAV